MSHAVSHLYRFGQFTIDIDQKVLLQNGVALAVTPKVFETLLVLVENAGRVVDKETLMGRVWPDTFVEEANLTFNITQLRKALGDSARKPEFVETVSRRGYRFIAAVEETGTDSLNPAGISSPETSTGSSKVWLGVIAVSILAVAIVGGWWLRHRRSIANQPSSDKLMLAVLPFQNLTGDASQEYFSDGLTEEMITQLGNLDPQHLGVIARTSVMHYKNSQAPLEQISRDLGVQYVLEGSVRRESDKVRITAQLIQIKDQTNLWSREYDRDVSPLLLLQEQIAQEVTGEIRLTLGNNQKSTETAHQASLSPQAYEAYDLYLKGEYFFNKRTSNGFEQAINYFQRATEKDPSSARAYAGLADCYALMGGYSGKPQTEFMPKAREAALRAIALDETLAEAHTALALVVQNYDWDWQTAGREFQRAIELNPNYATAHHWYAEHLTWLGRFDEALRESERARQLDPLSLIIAADNGAILYYSRQYDRAIAQFLAVREMDPNFPKSYLIDAAYEQKGQCDAARTNVEKLRTFEKSPWVLAEMVIVYACSGQQTEARQALNKLVELNRQQQVDPAPLLEAYVSLRDKDQAFAYLEKAYAQHSNSLTKLKVEPRFDVLRDDARFQEMEHRVGLQ